MAASVTRAATGSWGDFSAPTAKVMTPSANIVVGHRAFIVLATTVDGGSAGTITGCANNGSGLIRVTSTNHGLSTGDRAVITGVVGTTEANGTWTITNISANTFDLQGSSFVNTYTSGGSWTGLPGNSGWGAIDAISDPQGNTWNRDSYGGPEDNTNVFTTVEIWSAYVGTQINSSGWSPTITPDSRGLSAYWAVYDVSGLGETGGASSPLDKVARANDVSTTTWSTSTTATLAQAASWALAVHGCGSGAPTAPWFTDTAGFTSDYQVSGSAPGSARGLAVLMKDLSSTTGVVSTGSVPSNSGASTIAVYSTLQDASVTGVRGSVTVNGRQGQVSVSNPPASGAAAKLIVNQAAMRW